MKTGIPGLDTIFCGGLIRGNSLLIEGPPGSGKSTLGAQILHHGIVEYDEPALIINFEEFPKQVYRECSSYGFDLQKHEQEGKLRVIWTSPERVLASSSHQDDLIARIIEELGVKRMLIDSITHFKRVTEKESQLRDILHTLLNRIKLLDINAILVKELESNNPVEIAFEEYLVDASLRLYNILTSATRENTRLIEVRKTRGQRHMGGRHPFKFEASGIRIFPHLTPERLKKQIDPSPQQEVTREATGILGLDHMLHGGFLPRTMNMIVGYPGTGKSVMGMHFINEGILQGQNCLYISLQEKPDQLIASADRFGFGFRKALEENSLEIPFFSSLDLCIDEMINLIHDRLGAMNAKRVVFDSINELQASIKDVDLLQDYVHLLRSVFKFHQATSIVFYESTELAGNIATNRIDYGNIADTIMRLSMAEVEGEIRRVVGILKMQGSEHAEELRQFHISRNGMIVSEKIIGLSGVLSGNVTTNWKDRDDIIPPVEKAARLARRMMTGAATDPKLRESLSDLCDHLSLAQVLLNEHFGVTGFRFLQDSPASEDESPSSSS